MKSRLTQKLDLLVKLGALFRPLLDLADEPPSEEQRARILARYQHEQARFLEEFRAFTRGEPGHDYSAAFRQCALISSVGDRIRNGGDVKEIVRKWRGKARDAIYSVPIPQESVILDAGSPFAAYCRLRSLCEVDAGQSIVWFDPYFSSSIFHRYLQHASTDASITLVAEEPSLTQGKANQERWSTFLDASRLFAFERGPDKYRLILTKSMHDRWLVLNDKRIYHLGGSAKDAGGSDFYTIGVVEASETNLATVQKAILDSTEWFGPSTPTHR